MKPCQHGEYCIWGRKLTPVQIVCSMPRCVYDKEGGLNAQGKPRVSRDVDSRGDCSCGRRCDGPCGVDAASRRVEVTTHEAD